MTSIPHHRHLDAAPRCVLSFILTDFVLQPPEIHQEDIAMDALSFAYVGATIAIVGLLWYAMNAWRNDFKYYTASKCGHRTKRTGPVSAYEHIITMRMPRNDGGTMDYCLDCIGKMTIRCAWCDTPIFISSPVTLYTPRDDFQVPEYAVVYGEKPLQLVGCLGWNCAESGADHAGFWLPGEDGTGCVQRVPTLWEKMLGKSPVIAVRDARNVR